MFSSVRGCVLSYVVWVFVCLCGLYLAACFSGCIYVLLYLAVCFSGCMCVLYLAVWFSRSSRCEMYLTVWFSVVCVNFI